MDRQPELQALLSGIPGVTKAWFQAPGSDSMTYPCIVYALDLRGVDHADNLPYRRTKRYQVTVMDRNPLSKIPDAVHGLPQCSFERRYVVNGLYHDVFNLYF